MRLFLIRLAMLMFFINKSGLSVCVALKLKIMLSVWSGKQLNRVCECSSAHVQCQNSNSRITLLLTCSTTQTHSKDNYTEAKMDIKPENVHVWLP
jgi:hypothetical protein